MTEVKLGKYIPFYYFSRGMLDFLGLGAPLLTTRCLPGAFATTTSQLPNQILGGFSHVFRHYIPGSRCVRKDLDTGKNIPRTTALDRSKGVGGPSGRDGR